VGREAAEVMGSRARKTRAAGGIGLIWHALGRWQA
jgi:hypothetical protein